MFVVPPTSSLTSDPEVEDRGTSLNRLRRQSATPEGPTVSELDTIVEYLRTLRGRPRLESVLAIGQLLFDRFFEGSTAVWHDHSRNKANSLRRLAQRPSCPMSKSALHQAVAVYVASRSLAGVQTSGHIELSHIVAVLSFEDNQRELLLRLAAESRWSVRRLKREVLRLAPRASHPRGRARVDAVRRVSDRLRDCVSALVQATDSLRNTEIPLNAATELARHLEEMARAGEELAAIVDARPIQPRRQLGA